MRVENCISPNASITLERIMKPYIFFFVKRQKKNDVFMKICYIFMILS